MKLTSLLIACLFPIAAKCSEERERRSLTDRLATESSDSESRSDVLANHDSEVIKRRSSKSGGRCPFAHEPVVDRKSKKEKKKSKKSKKEKKRKHSRKHSSHSSSSSSSSSSSDTSSSSEADSSVRKAMERALRNTGVDHHPNTKNADITQCQHYLRFLEEKEKKEKQHK